MIISATELKINIGKYLVLSKSEDIIITKNNKPVARLTNVREDKLAILNSLIGIIPNNGYTLEDAKNERLLRNESNN